MRRKMRLCIIFGTTRGQQDAEFVERQRTVVGVIPEHALAAAPELVDASCHRVRIEFDEVVNVDVSALHLVRLRGLSRSGAGNADGEQCCEHAGQVVDRHGAGLGRGRHWGMGGTRVGRRISTASEEEGGPRPDPAGTRPKRPPESGRTAGAARRRTVGPANVPDGARHSWSAIANGLLVGSGSARP